jgi:hypothetical protein
VGPHLLDGGGPGAPPATRRNAAPIAFRLPAGSGPLVDEVVMREGDQFGAAFLVSRTIGSTSVDIFADPDRRDQQSMLWDFR